MNDSFQSTIELAKCIQAELKRNGTAESISSMPSLDLESVYDIFVSDEMLRDKTKKLFLDGHYAHAVEQAFKLIDNLVKERAGKLCGSKSGTGLMREAFSPAKPVIKLNDGLTDTDKDEQQGYMDIFAGCMMGIRNPRAHDVNLVDEKEQALRLLGFADHLILRVKASSSLTKK